MTFLSGESLKRRRRSQSELDGLDERLIGILEGIRPATVRQTYYQAVVHDLAEKDDSGYNLIQRRLLRLRRQHRIPYNWITDNVRTVYGFDRHPGLESFAQDVASLYRRDYWANSDVRVEIWIEADSLASTVTPVIFDWGLDLHVARGFSSETYLYNAGQAIRHDGRECFVYILSDFDPSGLVLAEKVAQGLDKFSGDVPVHVERLALNPEQVTAYHLPTRPLKKNDSRAKAFLRQYGDRAAELDALSPNDLRRLVNEAISRHADRNQIDMLKRTEENERRTLMSAFGRFS